MESTLRGYGKNEMGRPAERGRAYLDVIGFNDVVSSESAARRFFLGFCWKNHQRFCPRCRERRLYRLAEGRRRCSRCGYTFHDFSRRFIGACAFDCRQWMWFLKLFELGVAPRDMAVQMRVAYHTVLKAQDVLRRAILATALDAGLLYRAGLWPGPGTGRPLAEMTDSPVFGLIEVGGMAICDVMADMTPEDVLLFKCNFRLRTASVGGVVYTAPYQNYQTLVCCGPSLWPSRLIRHEDKNLPADATGFWIFAKRRLAFLRGVDPGHFPLHLKEWELRYNHRDEGLMEAMAKALCGFVPEVPAPGG
ncbi:MAG: transposase [Thermodesulfobacteriota bacterium]